MRNSDITVLYVEIVFFVSLVRSLYSVICVSKSMDISIKTLSRRYDQLSSWVFFFLMIYKISKLYLYALLMLFHSISNFDRNTSIFILHAMYRWRLWYIVIGLLPLISRVIRRIESQISYLIDDNSKSVLRAVRSYLRMGNWNCFEIFYYP